MEEVKTSEYRGFHWRYTRSFSNCLGMDAERNINGLRQRKSRRKPGWLSESSFRNQYLTDNIFFQLLDVAEGLDYLHTNHTTHGDLKGACSYSMLFLAASMTFD